jgi:hypothetical protein
VIEEFRSLVVFGRAHAKLLSPHISALAFYVVARSPTVRMNDMEAQIVQLAAESISLVGYFTISHLLSYLGRI